ncbi:HpcH/HpaI aldolase/citrate lyase family protein [Phytohabitans kaempferiae]|uniref:HpcH/HpaI aldolase/citrate lyase family protein n=1 Tax=Phytohabitans kaempferiae TaxID=1620943 RepID=A0ABV6MI18_9ACTN
MNPGSGVDNSPPAIFDDRPRRSWLFVPASDEGKLRKACGLRSDVVVMDLEDAVASERKAAARAAAQDWLPAYRGRAVAVRVNGTGSGLLADDLTAVVAAGPGAVILPKVQDPSELAEADALITGVEQAAGLPTGAVRLLPLIETAAGVARCDDILAGAPPRVLTALLGSGDLTADLGVDLTPEAAELQYARSRLVIAARAAALTAPIDGPWTWLDDLEGLAGDCRRSRRLGFQGRITLHPRQNETVDLAYAETSQEDVQRARRIVAAFEEARAHGQAAVRVDGKFVDHPIYLRALESLRHHS